MERLRQLLADASRYFSQLTKRERMLVMLAALSVVVFVGTITLSSISRSISRHELSIEEKLQQLQQVGVYAQTFNESERQRRELETKLGGEPVRLLSHMQELADKHGLAITSMNDRGETNLDQVKESLVELQIASAPIDKLTDLMNDIEHSPRILKVKKLRLRKNGGDPKALNVTLTIGSYQLVQKT